MRENDICNEKLVRKKKKDIKREKKEKSKKENRGVRESESGRQWCTERVKQRLRVVSERDIDCERMRKIEWERERGDREIEGRVKKRGKLKFRQRELGRERRWGKQSFQQWSI